MSIRPEPFPFLHVGVLPHCYTLSPSVNVQLIGVSCFQRLFFISQGFCKMKPAETHQCFIFQFTVAIDSNITNLFIAAFLLPSTLPVLPAL